MKLYYRFRSTYLYYTNKILFGLKGIKWPETLNLDGRLKLVCSKNPDIIFGKNVVICSGVEANPGGGGQKNTLFTVNEGARLVIDDGAGISNSTIVVNDNVYIGKNVNIGVNCIIYDTDMHAVDYKDRMLCENTKTAPVKILEGAWICGHSIILKGVTIGEKSVVAAGSVVTHDIPANELWGGNPAKFIRKINC